MRKIFIALLLFAIVPCFSQSGIHTEKAGNELLSVNDSTIVQLKREKDSLDDILEKQKRKEQLQSEASRNIDSILQLQEERKAKQKKAAFIRIALGLGFLIVLIIGLSRKKRKV